MPSYRVSLGFAELPDADLSEFVSTVVTKMTNNPSYPTPTVTLATLSTSGEAFAAALVAAAQGGVQLTAIKNAARAALVELLRTQAAYVQATANNDLSVILSSGFWNNSTDRTRRPLSKPVILDIDNIASTQLMVRLAAVQNARSFEFRIRVGSGDWKPAGVFTKARGILLTDLIPGAMYDIQGRAVGGSTGYSDWSDPVSHMAT